MNGQLHHCSECVESLRRPDLVCWWLERTRLVWAVAGVESLFSLCAVSINTRLVGASHATWLHMTLPEAAAFCRGLSAAAVLLEKFDLSSIEFNLTQFRGSESRSESNSLQVEPDRFGILWWTTAGERADELGDGTAAGAQHGQVGACYEEVCVGNALQHLHGCPRPLERPEPLISISGISRCSSRAAA